MVLCTHSSESKTTIRRSAYMPELCVPDPAANSDYTWKSPGSLRSSIRLTAQLGTYCQGQAQTATAQPVPLRFTAQLEPPDTVAHLSALEYLVPGITRSTDVLALELTLLSTCQHPTTRPGSTFTSGSPSEHHWRHACGTLQRTHNTSFASQHSPGTWNWPSSSLYRPCK